MLFPNTQRGYFYAMVLFYEGRGVKMNCWVKFLLVIALPGAIGSHADLIVYWFMAMSAEHPGRAIGLICLVPVLFLAIFCPGERNPQKKGVPGLPPYFV